MVETGTIKSVTITDGECSCEVDFGAKETETCVFYEDVGNNNYPMRGDDVAVFMTDGQNTILAVFRPIPDDLKKGEQVIYSRNSNGEIQANIKLTDDGEVNLNEGDDFAVMFNELKTAFDELLSDHNALVQIVNTITLPVVIGTLTAGPPPAPLAQSSKADMSSAKSEKVKL